MIPISRYLALLCATLIFNTTSYADDKVVIVPLIGDVDISNWHGPWEYYKEYKTADTVEYEGSSYIVITDHLSDSSNYPPSVEWNLVASVGAKGDPGASGPEGPDGPQGEKGEQGVSGQHGLEGRFCPDFVKGFDADGNLICGSDLR